MTHTQVYTEGVVRGWTPLEPANVMGQWQAIRLGVDRKPFGKNIFFVGFALSHFLDLPSLI
jgi:hypothetical protein